MAATISDRLRALVKELDGFLEKTKYLKNKFHHELTKIGGEEQFVEAERQILISSVKLKNLADNLEGKEQNEFNQINYFDEE